MPGITSQSQSHNQSEQYNADDREADPLNYCTPTAYTGRSAQTGQEKHLYAYLNWYKHNKPFLSI